MPLALQHVGSRRGAGRWGPGFSGACRSSSSVGSRPVRPPIASLSNSGKPSSQTFKLSTVTSGCAVRYAGPSTPNSNAGMRHEPTVTRSKSRAPATRSTSPGQRRLQLWSKKPHRTIGRRGYEKGFVSDHGKRECDRGQCRRTFSRH